VRRSLSLVVLLLLVTGSVARAETVAVLDSVFDGVPGNARADFEANLEESLRGAGFTVLPKETVKGLLVKSDAVAGCAFGPCLKAVGKALGVELALVSRISADGASFSFVLTLVDTATGVPVAQVSDTCAVCTFDEASSAATLAVVDLGTRYQEWRGGKSEPASPMKEPAKGRQHTWILGGLTVVAGGLAAYLLVSGSDDVENWGFAAAGGATGLALGTLFTF
jgi:hypothetical protein